MSSKRTAKARTLRLVEAVCQLAGPRNMLADTRQGMNETGIARAVERHDTDAIYNWLMEVVSYQGVSDAAAATYMREHGLPRCQDIARGLAGAGCPKLASYWHYEDCGYHKGSRTCADPEHFDRCHVPRLDLRNGRLNQSAYALQLFFRDVADNDIVGWIDHRLEREHASSDPAGTRVARMRQSLLDPLGQVHGLSSKVISMALASLLLGADPQRTRWVETGASMIAIDTLVHNWMHRTGILKDKHAEHAYGPRCYAPGGCADIIESMASQLDVRQFGLDYPAYFPRFVQKAIWWFCAQAGHNECNGNRIDDGERCDRDDCALWKNCARVPLRLVN
jgi:hypothetical protein